MATRRTRRVSPVLRREDAASPFFCLKRPGRWSNALASWAVVAFAWIGAIAPALRAQETRGPYDLIVYAGTPGGVACAVRAAREGVNVLLVNHREQLGGMLSDGLSVWDATYAGFRAPIFEEVRQSFWNYYRTTYGENSAEYKHSLPGTAKGRYESHVAAKLIAQLVAAEKRITLVSGYYPADVAREGREIRAVTFREMEGTKAFRATAKMFADCSYEGDLMAVARVASRIGRESRSEYNEPHAGRVFMKAAAWPPKAADPEELAEYRRLKLVHYSRWHELAMPQSTGDADPMIQAFNFRTVLSLDPANQRKVEKPANYDPAKLAHFSPRDAYGPMPNNKAMWNHPELIDGIPNAYVEGDWPARKRIIAEAKETTLALLYYLQNDPAVPEARRKLWQKYGLAKDEFRNSDNLPPGLYVREARRLVGRSVFTEHDARLAPGIKRAPIQADSIAITDWFLDSHACRSECAPGSLEDGAMLLNNQTWPGQVSYRALLPRDTDNLIVPVCLSASHVGWGAVRLEPTWMHLGESAGHAVALALKRNVTPDKIDADELLQRLARGRVMLAFFDDVDVGSGAAWLPGLEYLATKGFFTTYWARPGEPLTAKLAAEWLKAAGELWRGEKLDPVVRAQALHSVEREPDDAITGGEFARRLDDVTKSKNPKPSAVAYLASLSLSSDRPLTRAQACELIFVVLASPSKS